MRLYNRGGIIWCDARAEGFSRFSTGETDKRLAKAAAIRRITTSNPVVQPIVKGLTLGKAFERAMKYDWADLAKPVSVQGNINYVLRYFTEDRTLQSLTQKDVAAYRDWLREQPKIKSVSTLNKKILVLSSLLKLASEQWGIEGIPKLNLKVDKPKAQRFYTFNQQQIDQIRTHFLSLQDVFMADLTIYLSQTGKRLGEALCLKQRDIRMDAGFIDVYVNKADHPRGIPITPDVKEILLRRKKLEQPFGELKTHHIQTRWRAMRKALGLPDEAVIHALRHTYATRLVEATGDIQVVASILGHKQLTTTQIYAHMTDQRKLAASQAMLAKLCAI